MHDKSRRNLHLKFGLIIFITNTYPSVPYYSEYAHVTFDCITSVISEKAQNTLTKQCRAIGWQECATPQCAKVAQSVLSRVYQGFEVGHGKKGHTLCVLPGKRVQQPHRTSQFILRNSSR